MFSIRSQARPYRPFIPGESLSLSALAFVLIVASGVNTASAGIIFTDNFDAEAGSGQGDSGGSGLNYNSFANWTISGGTVDLIAQGDFASGSGIQCVGGSGKCVDLDGSNNNAGLMTSAAIALDPGHYNISYELAGVDPGFGQGAAGTPNTVDIFVREVSGGPTFFTDQQVRNQGDLFSLAGGTFDLASATSVEIVFQDLGNDNFGAVLDNVTLSVVPLPPTIALLLVGVSALLRLTRAHKAGNT